MKSGSNGWPMAESEFPGFRFTSFSHLQCNPKNFGIPKMPEEEPLQKDWYEWEKRRSGLTTTSFLAGVMVLRSGGGCGGTRSGRGGPLGRGTMNADDDMCSHLFSLSHLLTLSLCLSLSLPLFSRSCACLSLCRDGVPLTDCGSTVPVLGSAVSCQELIMERGRAGRFHKPWGPQVRTRRL